VQPPTSAQGLLDAAEAVVAAAARSHETDDGKVRERLANVVEALRWIEQAPRAVGWGFGMADRATRLRARLERVEDDLWLRVSERGLHIMAVQTRNPTAVNSAGALVQGGPSQQGLGSSGLADLLDLHPFNSQSAAAANSGSSSSPSSSLFSRTAVSSGFGATAVAASPLVATTTPSVEEEKASQAALKERRKQEGLFEPTAEDVAKLVSAAMQALGGMTAKSTPFDQLVQRRLRVLLRANAALSSQRRMCREVRTCPTTRAMLAAYSIAPSGGLVCASAVNVCSPPPYL